MNIFYKWLMKSKGNNLYRDLEDMIKSIDECGINEINNPNLMTNEGQFDPDHRDSLLVLKEVIDEKAYYNIFCGDIHIRMEVSPKERVYSIHLKFSNDEWKFNITENGKYDYSRPSTETFRVFVSYDVPVLNITRTMGDSYTHGEWDKYVYTNLNEIFDSITGCTASSRFNNAYKQMR